MNSEPMIEIRRFEENDWTAVWRIIEPVFRAGETYAVPSDISEKDAYRIWVTVPLAVYVAVDRNNVILGTYYLKPNQAGPGAHVCNCGYIVSEIARGQGIASRMCEHSQQEAIEQGFLSMQFNLVVATNESAVWVWKRNGFTIIGTVPKAFNHPVHGFDDAYIMYKQLT